MALPCGLVKQSPGWIVSPICSVSPAEGGVRPGFQEDSGRVLSSAAQQESSLGLLRQGGEERSRAVLVSASETHRQSFGSLHLQQTLLFFCWTLAVRQGWYDMDFAECCCLYSQQSFGSWRPSEVTELRQDPVIGKVLGSGHWS
ncbi:unnamed protein product [Prunus armeniaca]|uniref:Uncharacterized protein n=1 Tax=Prunus armeniaca TaxID=36596 RepID=A0A6J5VPE6_PRUAR|nr:unnamed protein product [Prunus armeniaca]